MIKWLLKWFRGKRVPKYLSGKKEMLCALFLIELTSAEVES